MVPVDTCNYQRMQCLPFWHHCLSVGVMNRIGLWVQHLVSHSGQADISKKPTAREGGNHRKVLLASSPPAAGIRGTPPSKVLPIAVDRSLNSGNPSYVGINMELWSKRKLSVSPWIGSGTPWKLQCRGAEHLLCSSALRKQIYAHSLQWRTSLFQLAFPSLPPHNTKNQSKTIQRSTFYKVLHNPPWEPICHP